MNSIGLAQVVRHTGLLNALIVIMSCLVMVGCGQNKSSVQAVMNQYQTAAIELTNSISALGIGDAFQKYSDKLHTIDIGNCPDDFRIAFVSYYQAVDAFKGHIDSTTGWRGVLKGFINPMAIFSVPDNTDKALKPLQEAGRNLVLVCTKYGLRFD